MSWQDLQEELAGAFPPGWTEVVDLDDPEGPGPLLESWARVLADHGETQVAQLRLELSPLTCGSDTLALWERILELDQTRAALGGNLGVRRLQVLSRLREWGPSTLALVRTCVGGYLQMGDPTVMRIRETPRAALRTAHTRVWTGTQPILAGALATWTVRDGPKVSQAGAQLDLTLDASVNLAELDVELSGPDGVVFTKTGLGRGLASTLRLYFPTMRGRPCYGNWRLVLTSVATAANLVQADLFVEGWGVNFDWRGVRSDGLGAAIYHWGPMADLDQISVEYDLVEADKTTKRLNYACRRGGLLLRPQDPLVQPNLGAIPDDPWCLPDMVVPE